MTENIPPFPYIELTPEDQARYDRNVASFLSDAVAEYSAQRGQTSEDAWIHVRRRDSLSIYKSVYGTRDPQVTLFKGTGLIHGPVEDVMDGIYCDTTEDLRACKVLLKYKLVNGSIMNVTERRSPEAPYGFAGIKWFASKAAWGLSKHRDVLAYERMGTTTDENGNELAYHVLHSIDHPDWPIDAIKGMKREHQVSCFLFRKHNESHVECFIWSTVYNLDSVAQRVAEYFVAGTLLSVSDCVMSARAKKYSLLMKLAQHNKWPASSLCHICYGRSLLSTNRPCAGCFQSVCKSCSDYRYIFHIDAKTGRPHQQRFCKLCINSTVLIDSHNFEATVKKKATDKAVEKKDVVRVADTQITQNRQNAPKSPTRTYLDSQSVAETSLRSNYLDWASDWSSQDDDDDEYLRERVGRDPKIKTKSCENVSLSDLDAEDKFSPYPPMPHIHRQQSEGRNRRVQENRVYQRRANKEKLQRNQSPLDQYAAPSRKHEPCYTNMLPAPLPRYRLPYQSPGSKTPESTHSFTVISSDSEEEAEVGDLPFGESGLGLSHFDLGVLKGSPNNDTDILDHSIYSDKNSRSQNRRAPRYGRTSHADKDGFLSDLYSMSRSRVHGKHF